MAIEELEMLKSIEDAANNGLDFQLTEFNFKDLSIEDNLKLSEIVKKINEDEEYDPYEDCPKSILNYIKAQFDDSNPSKKLMKDIVRSVLLELVEDKEMREEQASIKEEAVETVAQFKEMAKDYVVNHKAMMENKMKEAADKEEDPEVKAKLLKISEAYTNAYTLDPLYSVLDDKYFLKALKKEKLWSRICADFDYKVQRFSNAVRLDTVRKAMYIEDEKHPARFSRREAKILTTAMGVYARSANKENDTVWFLYNLSKNLFIVATTTQIYDDIKEKVDYLNKFFDVCKEKKLI